MGHWLSQVISPQRLSETDSYTDQTYELASFCSREVGTPPARLSLTIFFFKHKTDFSEHYELFSLHFKDDYYHLAS